MNLKNTNDGYGTAAKGLHWASALLVLGLLPLGFLMVSLDTSALKLELYWWHKSFGTLVFFVVALRLIWRFLNHQPAHIETHKLWERALAKIVHGLLYVGMIGMPLSGWLMSSAGDFTHSFFGLFEMPDLVSKDKQIFKITREIHELTAYALIAAVGLHGLGAFKHHFIDRDVTLTRMLPATAPRAGAIAAALVFALCLGGASLLALRHMLAGDAELTRPAVQTEAQEPATSKTAEPADDIIGTPDVQRWSIIPERSSIGFTVDVQGAPFRGQFTQYDGAIFFDPENLAESRADVRVAIGSVATGSAERDDYIRSKAWLFAESFPESRLVATHFEKTGENQYLARGTLTMRGVTLPVEVPFTLTISQNRAGETVAEMAASFPVRRLDFAVGEGEWSNPETVGITPVIAVSLIARRADDAPPQAD